MKYVFFCCVFCLLFACSSKKATPEDAENLAKVETENQTKTEESATPESTATDFSKLKLEWKFATEENDEGTPITKIQLVVDGKVVDITDEAEGAFDQIDKAEYVTVRSCEA